MVPEGITPLVLLRFCLGYLKSLEEGTFDIRDSLRFGVTALAAPLLTTCE